MYFNMFQYVYTTAIQWVVLPHWMAVVCTYRNMLKYLDNYDHAMALEKCYLDSIQVQIYMSVNVDHLTGWNMLISECWSLRVAND